MVSCTKRSRWVLHLPLAVAADHVCIVLLCLIAPMATAAVAVGAAAVAKLGSCMMCWLKATCLGKGQKAGGGEVRDGGRDGRGGWREGSEV